MGDQSRFELTGLDGSNPLGFLAALGAISALDRMNDRGTTQLFWTPSLQPTVVMPGSDSEDSVCNLICDGVKQVEADGVTAFGKIIGVDLCTYRSFLESALAGKTDEGAATCLLFAAAYGSDAVVDAKKLTVVPTALSFSNGQGGKLLLKDFRTLSSRTTPDKIHEALFEPWRYADTDQPTFRWDPSDMRTGAHMATDPGTTKTSSVLAANALAFLGLPFFPVVPRTGSLKTSGLRRMEEEYHLQWPLWQFPLSADVIRSLLQQSEWPEAMGIVGRFASRRVMFKKNLYLGPSFAI